MDTIERNKEAKRWYKRWGWHQYWHGWKDGRNEGWSPGSGRRRIPSGMNKVFRPGRKWGERWVSRKRAEGNLTEKEVKPCHK